MLNVWTRPRSCFFSIRLIITARAILQTGDEAFSPRQIIMPTAENVMTTLLASADIRIDGTRLWDIQVHDRHFFNLVLASVTLGFGESYMDVWWDCDALDEMCCRSIHAGLEKRFAFRLPNLWALFTALLTNQQTL